MKIRTFGCIIYLHFLCYLLIICNNYRKRWKTQIITDDSLRDDQGSYYFLSLSFAIFLQFVSVVTVDKTD